FYLKLNRGERITLVIQVKPNETNAVDLAGDWHEDVEWGDVHLLPKGDGYQGSYTATFNEQPGTLSLTRTGPSSYRGEWSESDRKFHGVFTLEARPDGQSLRVSWESRDGRPGGPRKGDSIWTKVKGPGATATPALPRRPEDVLGFLVGSWRCESV